MKVGDIVRYKCNNRKVDGLEDDILVIIIKLGPSPHPSMNTQCRKVSILSSLGIHNVSMLDLKVIR